MKIKTKNILIFFAGFLLLASFAPFCCAQDYESTEEHVLAYQEIDPEIKQMLQIQESSGISITMKKEISGMPSSFEDINEAYLPNGVTPDDVLMAQESAEFDVKTSMKFFAYSSPTEGSKDMTLVKKEVYAKIADYVIIEQLPPELVSSIDEVYFTEQPSILSQSPVVVSVHALSRETTFYYIVEGNAIDYLAEIQTIVSPSKPFKVKGIAYEEPKCGDGKCTIPLEDKVTCPEDCKSKTNWKFIIFLLVVMVIGIIIIQLFAGKKKFRPAKSPFASQQDEARIKSYVKSSFASGKTRSEIRSALLAKGWTEKQVEYVLHSLGR